MYVGFSSQSDRAKYAYVPTVLNFSVLKMSTNSSETWISSQNMGQKRLD